MAFEGAQMVPVYDMNKSDGDGFMGGGAGWMWVVMLFFLLAWGGGFGGFGGGANGDVYKRQVFQLIKIYLLQQKVEMYIML